MKQRQKNPPPRLHHTSLTNPWNRVHLWEWMHASCIFLVCLTHTLMHWITHTIPSWELQFHLSSLGYTCKSYLALLQSSFIYPMECSFSFMELPTVHMVCYVQSILLCDLTMPFLYRNGQYICHNGTVYSMWFQHLWNKTMYWLSMIQTFSCIAL